MFLSAVARYARLTWEIKKIHVLSAMEYRLSFFLQVLFSVVVHAIFIFLWGLFFTTVPTLGSWTMRDTATLISVMWCGDGLILLAAGGTHYLARMIAIGDLDYYLLLPHNLLWHIAVSRTDIYGLGVLGVAIANFWLFADSWYRMALFFGMSLVSAAITFNFILCTQSIGFFVGNFEDVAKKMMSALYTVTYYPYNVFSGLLRVVTATVIPAFFVGTIPAELVHGFEVQKFLLLLGYWAVTFVLAVGLFRQGLKRYESGSLIQVKL